LRCRIVPSPSDKGTAILPRTTPELLIADIADIADCRDLPYASPLSEFFRHARAYPWFEA
jgi:hypothetical protein